MACSDFKVKTKLQCYYEFEWNIDVFNIYRYNNTFPLFKSYLRIREITIPEFGEANGCPVKLKMILKLVIKNMCVSMFLKFHTSAEKKNFVGNLRYKVLNKVNVCEIKSVKNISCYINSNNEIFIGTFEHISYESLLWKSNEINLSDLFILRGTLTIENRFQKMSSNITHTNKYLLQLQTDFKNFLKNQHDMDVILNVGEDSLRAHKFVLCARSTVFETMFEQNFKENVNNTVDIEDMEKSVLEIFLEFLYCGVLVDCNFETIVALYSAADKYEVKSLQYACREVLTSSISENTSAVILKLADMHNDKVLKDEAMMYICKNFAKVELTSEWIHLLDTDPTLASYALRIVSTKL